MRATQRYRGESLRRVQQCLDAHPDVFGAINASPARGQLDEAIAQLGPIVDVQGARMREARGEKQRQVELERELRDHNMAPVAKFALGKLASVPNIGALTPSATRLRGARLVQAARAMAEAAIPHAEEFAAASFPADFAQQLIAAADAVRASIEARSRKAADRQHATAAVEETLKRGRSAALMLEGAVDRLVPRRSPLYAEWRAVKRIFSAGSRKQQDPKAQETQQETQQVQAPAPTAAATDATKAGNGA
jgi:hypothetical protein